MTKPTTSDLHYDVILRCGNCLFQYEARIPKKITVMNFKPPCKNCGCFEYSQVIDPHAMPHFATHPTLAPYTGLPGTWPEK